MGTIKYYIFIFLAVPCSFLQGMLDGSQNHYLPQPITFTVSSQEAIELFKEKRKRKNLNNSPTKKVKKPNLQIIKKTKIKELNISEFIKNNVFKINISRNNKDIIAYDITDFREFYFLLTPLLTLEIETNGYKNIEKEKLKESFDSIYNYYKNKISDLRDFCFDRAVIEDGQEQHDFSAVKYNLEEYLNLKKDSQNLLNFCSNQNPYKDTNDIEDVLYHEEENYPTLAIKDINLLGEFYDHIYSNSNQ